MVIKKGSKIKVEYEGSLDNGEVFDTSKGRDPLDFTVGEGKIIPGFENALIGMEKGEEKKIKIEPKEAYGDKKPELLKKIPKAQLPEDSREKIEPGMVLGMKTPDGKQFPVKVTGVGKEDITLDLNHPLAGQNLNFRIKVIDIQ